MTAARRWADGRGGVSLAEDDRGRLHRELAEDRLLELIAEQRARRARARGPRVRGGLPAPAVGRRPRASRPRHLLRRGARRRSTSRPRAAASRSRCARSTRRATSDGYEPLGSVLETNTDDWPFLVDSVSARARARAAISVARLLHPIIGIERDERRAHRAPSRDPRDAAHRESVMHFDLDRRLADDELAELEDAVRGDAARRARTRHATSAR